MIGFLLGANSSTTEFRRLPLAYATYSLSMTFKAILHNISFCIRVAFWTMGFHAINRLNTIRAIFYKMFSVRNWLKVSRVYASLVLANMMKFIPHGDGTNKIDIRKSVGVNTPVPKPEINITKFSFRALEYPTSIIFGFYNMAHKPFDFSPFGPTTHMGII
jgi:hypothetical protein